LLNQEKTTNKNSAKKRKYRSVNCEEKVKREITLEENTFAEIQMNCSPTQHDEVETEDSSSKSYKCDRCDKDYKFASGLHHHYKHNHKDEKK